MVSINSASSNAFVLSNIRSINSDLSVTQTRIASGKKVNSASDNPSVWALAQSIRADQTSQNSISSGITLAKSRSNAAIAGIDSAQKILTKMTEMVTAAGNSPDYTVLTSQFLALKSQLSSAMNGAEIKGVSYLTDATAVSVTLGAKSTNVASFAPVNQTVASDTADILAFTSIASTGTSPISTLANLQTEVNGAVAALNTYRTSLSVFSNSLEVQEEFLTALSSIRNSAISDLVDADLTEESAKLTALQTQQQLAYQALSISNSSAQNILRLFQ